MKKSFTGKTLFVPRHCLDEVERLIAKRRKQHLIDSLDNICSDKDRGKDRGKDACLKMKAVIDATCDKEITIDDCKAMIARGALVIPMRYRVLFPYGRVAHSVDYLAIYKWYIGGEK